MAFTLFISFVAGLLTVLAPCTLLLLPITLGSSVGGSKWRPLVVSLSLGVSVIAFTLLIKMSGALLDFDGNGIADIPEGAVRIFSGSVILLFSATLLFPKAWEWLTVKLRFYKSQELLEKSSNRGGIWGAMLVGLAFGPIFNSCSPTYLILLSQVLPADFSTGVLALLSYTTGLVLFLLAIGYGGRAIVNKLRWAANPHGWFKKVLGVIFVIVGVVILLGWDKVIEAWIIQQAVDLGIGDLFLLESLFLPGIEG